MSAGAGGTLLMLGWVEHAGLMCAKNSKRILDPTYKFKTVAVLKVLKILKVLRVLKILKVLRLWKVLKVLAVLQYYKYDSFRVWPSTYPQCKS